MLPISYFLTRSRFQQVGFEWSSYSVLVSFPSLRQNTHDSQLKNRRSLHWLWNSHCFQTVLIWSCCLGPGTIQCFMTGRYCGGGDSSCGNRKNKGMGRTGSKYLSKGVLWMTQIPSRPLKTFRNLKTPTLSTVFYIATSWWPSLQYMDFLETFNTQTVVISMMWVSYDPVALLRL